MYEQVNEAKDLGHQTEQRRLAEQNRTSPGACRLSRNAALRASPPDVSDHPVLCQMSNLRL